MLHGHERSITQIKYNRDGDLLLSSAKDTKPNVWYSLNGERLGTYNGHGGAVWCIDVDCILQKCIDDTVFWYKNYNNFIHSYIWQFYKRYIYIVGLKNNVYLSPESEATVADKPFYMYIYGLLTKCEVKMARYWPSTFFACLWTETKSRSIKLAKKERGQCPAILTEKTWSIKD